MELTKQDKKNIETEVTKLAASITCKATEYAKLYEAEFYRQLAERLNARVGNRVCYGQIQRMI